MNKESKISFRLTKEELIELERLMANSNIKNRTEFIRSILFNRSIAVVKVDPNMQKYLICLNNLQAEYRAIGNNYNQVTKAIKGTFTEKKALAFLYKLADITRDLIKVNNEIIELTKEVKEKWLQK